MDTLNRTLDVLASARLVRFSKSAGFPFSKKYELTELGRRLVSAPITEWEVLLEIGPSSHLDVGDVPDPGRLRRVEIRPRQPR